MDKMLAIGIKKSIFSVEDVFQLVYGETFSPKVGVRCLKWKVNDFWKIPISYRKELVKKVNPDLLRKYAYCIAEVAIDSNGRFLWNTTLSYEDIESRKKLIDEFILWLKWGVKFGETNEMIDGLIYIESCVSSHPMYGLSPVLTSYTHKIDELMEKLGYSFC
jgi:hypothetical protein